MSRITRRHALGVAAGAALGLAATGQASADPARTTRTAPRSGRAAAAAAPGPFDEVFKGRRIQGRPVPHGGGHHGGHHEAGYSVLVDGRELHVMRNADGTWISVINHYEPFATPRAVARAAVLELQGSALVPLAVATA
ncbi:tyrosinase cofactor [Streptomyces sp. NPDC050856]|uniref:apotyrosinase chaperone MelC1 n=1 Tax=unclassified Streptomyces TaxID=2593676 RepID=UPI0033FCFA6C